MSKPTPIGGLQNSSPNGNLKTDHPYVYKRVRLKAIVNTLLGLSLIFTTSVPTQNADATRLSSVASYQVWGAIFLVLGMGIAYGLTRGANNYRIARYFLAAAAAYAFFWLCALFIALFTGKLNSASIIILWGYFTYNLFLLSTDPGWTVAQIVKELRDGKRD